MKGRNILISIVLLTSILLTTIVYAAFSTQLNIEGEAIVRSDQDIRITNIDISNTTNGAYETYNNKYNKDTTFMYVTLPANSSITYDVTITNTSNIGYDVSNIQQLSNTNNNIDINISLNVGDIVNANSTKTFTITLTNNTSTNQIGTIIYQYSFVEHINSYVVETYSTPSSYQFTVPYTGKYKIEIWGAQGGENIWLVCENIDKCSIGGYGGYSTGYINLTSNDNIFIQVGAQGGNFVTPYNGGGYGAPSGGGATSVTTSNRGELYNFENYTNEILMVAGGGGGDDAIGQGGHGGGFKGTNSYYIRQDVTPSINGVADGGTQTEGGSGYENGSFGKGGGYLAYAVDHNDLGGAGGGGFYGGGAGRDPSWSSGGGGSGYIGNIDLYDKYMACYECDESQDESVKTISVNCKNSSPEKDCAKLGNGAARITFIERTFE